MFNGIVEVVAGESRRWELAPGRYTITVKVSLPRDLNSLHMETEGVNCARDWLAFS